MQQINFQLNFTTQKLYASATYVIELLSICWPVTPVMADL